MIPKEWYKHHYLCCLCHESSAQQLCLACEEDFLLEPLHRCHCCGLPLEDDADFCGQCLKPPPYCDQTFSPFIYTNPLSELILQFKEKGNTIAGEAITQIFSKKIIKWYQQRRLEFPELLVPTPLHWRKYWKRGFNHADVLCQRISKDLQIRTFQHSKRQHNQQHDQKN